MRASKRILRFVFAGLFLLSTVELPAAEQPKLSALLIGEVSASVLPGGGRDSKITAFDLAPDGDLLAVLYSNWSAQTNFKLSVAIWDVRARAVVQNAQVGVHDVSTSTFSLVDDEVTFTADKKYLIVLGLGKVWILDASTCAVVRSIDSPRAELGEPVHFLTADRSTLAVTYKQGYNQFNIALFEIPSAKITASWQSSAFPQSFSPDGNLAVGPDAEGYNQGGVSNLLVMDARTGAKIKSIPVSFGFKKWRPDGKKGSFTARFVDNEEVVVTPDNMTDHTGHHSGNSMEVVNVREGRLAREITPKNFGPTGELTVSSDLCYFAVYSHNVSGFAKLSDGLWPDFDKPQLMLYSADETKPELVIPGLKADGAVAHLRNMILPSLSNNASVVALAQAGAVKVFQIKE